MKVLAIVLLCAVAAVQGRSAGLQSIRAVQPADGDDGVSVVIYLVHLRVATTTSGLLQTGVGSLIGSNWVLTAASNVRGSSFIWIRYGVVNVISPSLVTETNAVTANPGYDASSGANNLALININRIVESTANHAPVPGLGGSLNAIEKFYGFGQDEAGRPGEQLRSYDLSLTENEGVYSGSSRLSRFDIGAPVVSGRQQTGLLVAVDDEGVGSFQAIDGYVSWIQSVTNLDFSQPEPEPEA